MLPTRSREEMEKKVVELVEEKGKLKEELRQLRDRQEESEWAAKRLEDKVGDGTAVEKEEIEAVRKELEEERNRRGRWEEEVESERRSLKEEMGKMEKNILQRLEGLAGKRDEAVERPRGR